jgi:GNAT superfamily N-acetyltransferase
VTPPANPRKPVDHRVERADARDVDVLARVIADAFFDLAVSSWLVPDPGDRRAIFAAYFRLHVEHALSKGLVLTTPARDAAALWIRVRANGPVTPPDGYHERLAAVTGSHLARFQALDDGFDRHHPVGVAHAYLAILAVRPDRQRLGIGTALLRVRHAILDREAIPAYLEASDAAKRDIYLEHGYVLWPDAPIILPDGGPELFPMWREPRGSGYAR